MKLQYLLCLGLLALPVRGADWYVDSDASTNGNGQAWATAWQQLTNIVWASVSAGDTIWLSGGSYYGINLWTKGGTTNSPIRIKKAQTEGHNDHATLYGRISIGANWIELDGAKDDSYTNNINSTVAVLGITNNIGWTINSSTVTNHAINIYSGGPLGVKFKWLEVTTGGWDSAIDMAGFNINAGDIHGTEIAYCWIHDTSNDGINQKNDSNWGADSIEIHHNIVERVGDDGITFNGGSTIHHNYVRNTLNYNGHPDGIVGLGHNAKIYNNIIYDWNTEPFYPGISRVVHTNFYFYGNLIYSEDFADSQEAAALYTVEGSFPWKVTNSIEGGWTYTTNAWWGNVVIANNTFIAGRWVVDPLNMPNRYSPENKVGEPGLIVSATNWIVKNNIFYGGKSYSADFKGYTNSGWEHSGWQIAGNVFYSATNGASDVRFKSVSFYTNAIDLDLNVAEASGNTNAEPKFVDLPTYDFRLSSIDTAARGLGENLAALSLPGIEYDIYGTYRGASAWDSGAIAYTNATLSNTLLLSLQFEGNFPSNGYAADSSGNDARMLRYGWGSYTTNFPTITTGKAGTQAAAFLPYYDSHPYTNDLDFIDGQYGAITNVGSLNGMTQATFAAWVKFANTGTTNDTLNHNATIMDAGYGVLGAWHFGRYYSTSFGEPQFNILTNTGAGISASWRNKWPQVAYDWWYTNETWIHLAATVDCGDGTNLTVRLFTNGLPCVTNTITVTNPIYSLKITDPAGAAYGPWIGVGCWTHNGTPPLEDSDDIPNNGWLNGALDDVRIYNSILSDAEISGLGTYWGDAPTITSQPASGSIYESQSYVFTVVASGTEPISYEWYKDDEPLEDGSQSTFTITSASITDQGTYKVIVSNPSGSATSDEATLTVAQGTPTPGGKGRWRMGGRPSVRGNFR